MAWIDRFIDHLPDTPESVGSWMVAGGAIGTIAALFLRDVPLSVESTLLYLAGAFGPALHDLKQRMKARRAAIPVRDDRHEDARVDAYVLAKKREAVSVSFQKSSADEARPPRHRLH